MSKKRPTESSWDSDEELLSDTSGITAFPKTSELDLLGDDGELDEDALLDMDEAGTKSMSVSFANDSVRPVASRQRSKVAAAQQDSVPAEQAFVFEETDTADLEDELNVGGQEEDHSGYHNMADGSYSAGLYHKQANEEATHELHAENEHANYSADGMQNVHSEEVTYVEHAEYEVQGSNYDATGYVGDGGDGNPDEGTGVELGYEQPVEQEGQVLLEYGDSQESITVPGEAKDPDHFESESDSDEDSSRHGRGKFTSERTGVISLTPATARETIPDTLEINAEQAAQIEQFMSDKNQKGKGKTRGQRRPSAHSRLGTKPGLGPQIPGLLQGPPTGSFPRGMLGQRMGFPFPGGLQNQGPFPGRMMNLRSAFSVRLMNQRPPFLRAPPNQRGVFMGGLGAMRGPFPMRVPSVPQRNVFPQQSRFPVNNVQRASFIRGPLSQGPPKMAQVAPQSGPLQMRGPRQQMQINQRGPNPMQLGHGLQMGQGIRVSMVGVMGGGPRPLMGPEGPRFRPSGSALLSTTSASSGQPIPSLVKPVATQLRHPNITQTERGRVPPHQRLGPMQGQPRSLFQNNQSQGSTKFLSCASRVVASQGYPQPLMGDGQLVRKHKIYINPRFQGQQNTPGPKGIARTVKMGTPVQQKKAKALLERAIQVKKKPAVTPAAPVATAGVKRKSTGGDDPPPKVLKTDDNTPSKEMNIEDNATLESSQAVQASDQPVEGESKIKALLEEQKRKREMIQRQKELARQKQAAIKRRELENRLKEEGKTVQDILGNSKDENKMEQEQTAPVKEIKGSVAARLGPPPTQQLIRGPIPLQQQQQQQHVGHVPLHIRPVVPQRPPGPQRPSGPQRPQQFQRAPQQFQNIQARTPTFTPQFPNPAGITSLRVKNPVSEQRFVTQSMTTDVRFLAPQASNQQFKNPSPNQDIRFRSLQPSVDLRLRGSTTSAPQFRAPTQSTDPRLRVPPPNMDPRIRGPAPTNINFRGPLPTSGQRLMATTISDTRLRAPPAQSNILQTPSVLSQPVRFAAPVAANLQNVRYQPPPSAPPQVPHPQHYPPQYPPSSAPAVQSPQHYIHPNQPPPAPYSAPPSQYTPQTASYQPPTYPPPSQSHYQQQASIQLPTPTAPQYSQTPTPQYPQALPPQYQHPTTPQYGAPSTPQYQLSTPQYPAPSAYQYPPTTQSYDTPTDQHYQQQQHYDYYSEPQPIQTITGQTSNPPAGDQRTVQHHSPVGQRIQTIGQHVQPVTGTQMRSIIHNMVHPKSSSSATTPARTVQTRTPGSSGNRTGADRQIAVLEGPQKILIQNVPQMATKETLIKICRHFGQVLGVNLMREQNKAVVQFQKGEQAAKCVAKCDQKCLHKTRLTVKLLPS